MKVNPVYLRHIVSNIFTIDGTTNMPLILKDKTLQKPFNIVSDTAQNDLVCHRPLGSVLLVSSLSL